MLEYNLDLSSDSYQHVLTLDELAQSFPFYPTEVGFFHAKKSYFTRRDGLANFLLIVTVGGSGQVTWKGQKSTIQRGQAVLIDCLEFHEYATLADGEWSFYYMHFRASTMEGYGHFFLQNLTVVNLQNLEIVCRLMEKLYRATFEKSVLTSASQSNTISAILTEVSYSTVGEPTGYSGTHRIGRLAEYIKENCKEDLHLEDFMGIAHLSKYHLIRTFVKHIGMSPYKYLHLCRIDLSLDYLKNTDFSVAQIAVLVGYSDSVTYIRHFKSFHKMSPGKYRASFILMQE